MHITPAFAYGTDAGDDRFRGAIKNRVSRCHFSSFFSNRGCYRRIMPFEPDIIVTGPDASDVALVVEVNLSNQRMADSERQLKGYMASVGSPVGLLVTPQRLRLYRDRYLPSVEDSIAEVGDFDVNSILPFRPTRNAQADSLDFERSVQSWLEGLSTETGLRRLSPELRRAAQMYIVPALAQGVVRSGHPRFQTKN